jgi:hypothetical protein
VPIPIRSSTPAPAPISARHAVVVFFYFFVANSSRATAEALVQKVVEERKKLAKEKEVFNKDMQNEKAQFLKEKDEF